MKRLALLLVTLVVCPSLLADAASAKKKLERSGNELTATSIPVKSLPRA